MAARHYHRFFPALLGGALLFTACASAPPVWTLRNGGRIDADGFRQTNYRCVQESRTSWSGGGTGLVGIAVMASAQANAQRAARNLYVMCMEAAGYRALSEEELARRRDAGIK